MSVHEVFSREEQRCLVAGKPPFRGNVQRRMTASGTCLVVFDNNRYPALARAADRPARLRARAEALEAGIGNVEIILHDPARQCDPGPVPAIAPPKGNRANDGVRFPIEQPGIARG